MEADLSLCCHPDISQSLGLYAQKDDDYGNSRRDRGGGQGASGSGQDVSCPGRIWKCTEGKRKRISLAGKKVLVDEALFYIGLIHAHPANPARDYGKSMVSFRRLITDYPGSPMVEQAKIVVGLLHENDKLNRTTDKLNNIIDKQKKMVDRLNNIIDELKQVDIGVERKKREKAK